MYKLLKITDQSLLPISRSHNQTFRTVPFTKIDKNDFAVTITEHNLTDQYQVGTIARVAQVSTANIPIGTHVIVTLRNDISILRALTARDNNKIEVNSIGSKHKTDISLSDVLCLYVVKSLYYRSDM